MYCFEWYLKSLHSIKYVFYCIIFLSIWNIIVFQAGAKGLCNQLSQWEGCFSGIISSTEFVSSFPDASYLKLACFKLLSFQKMIKSILALSLFKHNVSCGRSKNHQGSWVFEQWTVFTDWIYFEYFENGLLKFHCIIKHLAELSLGMDFKSEIFGF